MAGVRERLLSPHYVFPDWSIAFAFVVHHLPSLSVRPIGQPRERRTDPAPETGPAARGACRSLQCRQRSRRKRMRCLLPECHASATHSLLNLSCSWFPVGATALGF